MKEKLNKADESWIRSWLARWGLYCQDGGIGYPSISAHESLRLGRGVFDGVAMPDDVHAVDRAVATLSLPLKRLVIEVYVRKGKPEDQMIRLRLQRWAYYEGRNTAELLVYRHLQGQTKSPTFQAA